MVDASATRKRGRPPVPSDGDSSGAAPSLKKGTKGGSVSLGWSGLHPRLLLAGRLIPCLPRLCLLLPALIIHEAYALLDYYGTYCLNFNVNGLRDSAKRAGILRWLRALPSVPDVVCLQEAHCTSLAECPAWFLSSGFEFSVSPGTVKSAGCILLFHSPLSLVASWTDSTDVSCI